MDNKYNCLKLIAKEQGDEIEMCQSLDMFAQKNRLQGKEEGKREGMLEGKREGILEGKREGKLEGKREGILEGKREGKLEGKREGVMEGKASLLIKVLSKMFPSLPKDVFVVIKNGNEEQLDYITECLFDIKEPSDVIKLLQ